MIEKQEIFDKVLKAVPSYNARYQKYIEESYEAGEERLLYIDICDFIEYVIECYQHKQTDEFDNLFEMIEELHNRGDSYVKEFATIGILETLQNKLLDKHMDYKEFEVFLKPESRKWWDHVIDFWDGKTAYVGGPFKQ